MHGARRQRSSAPRSPANWSASCGQSQGRRAPPDRPPRRPTSRAWAEAGPRQGNARQTLCGRQLADARSKIGTAPDAQSGKKVEMLFAHLKRILRLDRLRLRGPNGAKDEFHLAAAAQNLRKLAKLIPMPEPMPV
ncbi:transposase [Mesorhizobium sp. M0340]|uniref:transposase n=1 Tax=Mesorhizobium sp. M0340 TaxID=2956939 RepID=UPI003339195F